MELRRGRDAHSLWSLTGRTAALSSMSSFLAATCVEAQSCLNCIKLFRGGQLDSGDSARFFSRFVGANVWQLFLCTHRSVPAPESLDWDLTDEDGRRDASSTIRYEDEMTAHAPVSI